VGLVAVTIITLVRVMVTVSGFRRVCMLMPVRVLMFMAGLKEVLMRIMKVDVPFPDHLANQIVSSEK
jgi:hypothetical protein